METVITALDRLNAGVFSVDRELRIVHWNLFMATNSGRPADQVIGGDLFACFPELPEQWLRWKLRSVFLLGTFAFSSWKQRPYLFRFPHNRPLTGGIDFMHQDIAFLPIAVGDAVGSVCVLVTDVTDAALSQRALHDAHARLEREMAERQRVEHELRLAHKLEAVGQLAAGIAHEINTPLQYIADSISFLGEAFAEMRAIVGTYRQALRDRVQHLSLDDDPELAYLESNVPDAVDRAQDGLERVASLVRAMKEFGQPAASAKSLADLNRAVTTTLTITRSAYKDVADIELELGDVQEVPCHLAELNQVFLQLIVNAAHAIAETHVVPARGTIRIRTWCDDGAAYVAVADNGSGIPEAIRPRIFDPFFTTKPVGRGTGQGLSIARSIVVDRHAGTLSFETTVGRGSTFLVRLPR
ncbi:MAG TPA: ATP-binding protein [Kofleriaceae bacterium]|jgi:two-component system NtrC family sensor kinase